MYKVTAINNGTEIEIHNPKVNGLKLNTGVMKRGINTIDSFSISFNQNNPAFGQLRPLQTLIKVENTKTNTYEFEGRVLGPSDEMDQNGLHSTSYDCEGELGYLHDSQQRHVEYRVTPRELLIQLIAYHNQQVESYKRFEVGNVTVTNSTDNLYVYVSAEEDTFQAIENKLLDRIGGELQIRKENGTRYLDLLERIGNDKSTEIRLAKNLRSMSRSVDPTEIITRLTPLGTRVESEAEGATDASQARLTIESVNQGIPYLDDQSLIAEFGIQGGRIVWDDVTQPENLLSNGLNWLANQKTARVQFEISAADLSLIGLDMDSFEPGNTHPVFNPIMGIDERLRIVSKSTDINKPENASMKIGEKFKTLREYQRDSNRSTRIVNQLEEIVDRQSQTIGALRNEVSNVGTAINQIEIILDENDLPALEDAIDNLNQSVDNLVQAINQIPAYEPATQTVDGLFSAVDKAKLDLLTVTTPLNLNEVLQQINNRLEALENGQEQSS